MRPGRWRVQSIRLNQTGFKAHHYEVTLSNGPNIAFGASRWLILAWLKAKRQTNFWRPPEPGEKPTFTSYVVLAILALFVLHWMKESIEADPLRCNRLNAKPPLAGYLTCQKTYHYQPDPFTG
jgi:hypothetical protein